MHNTDFLNRKTELNAICSFGSHLENRHRVLFACSETGVGKSALVRHYLATQEGRLAIKTSIIRTDELEGVPYLNQIAEQIDLWAEERKRFVQFSEFVASGFSAFEKRHFLSEVAVGAAGIVPGGSAISPAVRKALGTGEYNAERLLYGAQYSNDYTVIRYIVEFFNRGNSILSIDNIQEIDQKSISYISNIIRESRPGYWIFEYTRGTQGIDLQQLVEWVAALGCQVKIYEVEPLPWRELSQAFGIHDATIEQIVQKHYRQSKGNLKELFSFRHMSSLVEFSSVGGEDVVSGTRQLLQHQRPNCLMVIALIAMHDGQVPEALLMEVFKCVPVFQVVSELTSISEILVSLIGDRILTRELGLIRFDHDSVLRVFFEIRVFEKYILIASRAWHSLYLGLKQNGDFFISEAEIVSSLIYYSFKIGDDAELWSSLKYLAEKSLNARAPKNVEVYVTSLYRRIERTGNSSRKYLHALTVDLVRLLYKVGSFETAMKLVALLDRQSEVAAFYHVALLSELDKPFEALEECRKIADDYKRYSAGNMWKAAQLILVASLRMANKVKECTATYEQLQSRRSYEDTPLEPYFRLLAGVALPATRAIESVRKSAELFAAAHLDHEANCARITLAQLFGDVGRLDEAASSLQSIDASDRLRNISAELNNRAAIDIKKGVVGDTQKKQLVDAALLADDDFSLFIIYINIMTVSGVLNDLPRAFEAAGTIRRLLDSGSPLEYEIRRIASFNLSWFYERQNLLSEAKAMLDLSKSIPSEINGELWDYRFGRRQSLSSEHTARAALEFEVPMFAYWQLDVSRYLTHLPA